MRKCTEKIELLQDFLDIAEEDWIFAFVNPFLLSEQQNIKMPITHKEKSFTSNKFNIENVIWRTFLQSSPWCSWCDSFLAILTTWNVLRTTKICSSYISFWNNVHMRKSIFVHKIDQKQSKVTPYLYKFERLSGAHCSP